MTITPNEALTRCIEHREIFHDEMLHLMRMLMRGKMSPQLASALLIGLRIKKETIGEITADAQVMREFATPVHTNKPEDLLGQQPYLQYVHHGHVRGGGGGRSYRQAWQP